MAVVAGTQFATTLITPGGIAGGNSVGARIEVPVTRAIASMFVRAVLNDSTWTVTLTAPLFAGSYCLVWMTGDDVPPAPFPIFVPLFVVATSTDLEDAVDYPPVDMDAVTPDISEVAALERTRTRDTDTGEDYGAFTERTSPTDAEVESIIPQAVKVVLSQLRTVFDPTEYDRVRQAAALQAAVLIEGSYFRAQAEETGGTAAVWSRLLGMLISGLQNDIERDLNQALLAGEMEPRQPQKPWQRRLNS